MAKIKTITIDNERNDDWMKALPGYQDEVAITEAASRKKPKSKMHVKVKRKMS